MMASSCLIEVKVERRTDESKGSWGGGGGENKSRAVGGTRREGREQQ